MTSTDNSIKSPHLPLLLLALTAAHLFGNCTLFAVAAVATDLKRELNIGAEDYGWLISIYMIVQGVIAIPGGLLIDYLGSRIVFAASLLIAAAGTAFVANADSFWMAFLGMGFIGSGYGLVNPCTSKTVFEHFPKHRRASAMGIKQTGVPIGGALGALIAGAMVADFGRSHVLSFFAVIIASAAALALLLPRQLERPQLKPISGMMAVMRDKNLQIFNTAIGIFQASMYGMLANLAAFCREALHADPALASATLSIAHTASALGRVSWGTFSDLVFAAKRKPVLLIIGACGTVLLFVMASVSTNWPFFLVLVLAFPAGLAVAGYVGLTQTITVEAADPKLTATAVGSNRIFTSAGAGMGLPFFGWLVDNYGYTEAWIALGTIFALGTTVVALFFKEK
ncbi:MAG: MFS transporter [Proteobacteria bacterium]|nr:MFS transporter [Pseudomonadota bacterium]